MDYIRFVNSRDIREYLYSLDYKLTGEQKLYLVDKCYRIPLSEKIKALESLLSEPDSEVTIRNPSYQSSEYFEGRNHAPEKVSVHDLAGRIIGKYSRLTELFYDTRDEACYVVSILNEEYNEYRSCNLHFISSEAAVVYCRKLKQDYGESGVRAVEIKKIYLLGDDPQKCNYQSPEEIIAIYDDEMNMMNIHGTNYENDDIDSTDGLYIYLPVPFKKGDILVKSEDCFYCGDCESAYGYKSGEPFVALSFYPDETLRGGADVSDINCEVNYFNKFRRLELEDDALQHNYDLEYCRKPLTGKFKLLKLLSAVLQNSKSADPVTMLVAVKYCKTMMAFEDAKNELFLYPTLEYLFADSDEQHKMCDGKDNSYIPASEALRFTDSVRIWLDDERCAPPGYLRCRSVNETISMIRECEKNAVIIEELNLDHDLGMYASEGGDAIKVLDFLAERETFYRIVIHTANPVGRQNMMRMIDRYWPK